MEQYAFFKTHILHAINIMLNMLMRKINKYIKPAHNKSANRLIENIFAIYNALYCLKINHIIKFFYDL